MPASTHFSWHSRDGSSESERIEHSDEPPAFNRAILRKSGFSQKGCDSVLAWNISQEQAIAAKNANKRDRCCFITTWIRNLFVIVLPVSRLKESYHNGRNLAKDGRCLELSQPCIGPAKHDLPNQNAILSHDAMPQNFKNHDGAGLLPWRESF